MKTFLKFVGFIFLVFIALSSYRLFSFEKGFSKTNMENKSVVEVLTTVAGISKVEYYKRPFISENPSTSTPRPANYQSEDYIYNVYIVSADDAYLLRATKDDITAFKTLSIFTSKLQPQKITLVPFYIEIGLAIVILFIPTKSRKR